MHLYYLLQRYNPIHIFASATDNPTPQHLCNYFGQDNSNTNTACGLPTVNAGSSELQSVLQIAFGVLSALAVLFIVIGGLRMVTSQGNPQEASKARATLIYAVVGLIIALLAEAFVSFVLDKL